MFLLDFFENVFSPLRLRGKSLNTVRLYHCTIRSFAKFLERRPVIEDLADELLISRFLSKRALERSAFTAEKERTQLLCLARFAHDRGILKTRPYVPATPLPERIPSAWSIDQIRSLCVATGKEEGFVGKKPASLFWRCLIAVLYESSERIGAAVAVRVSDYRDSRILVRGEYRKGGKRDRLYSLTPATSLLVEEMCRGRKASEPIFDWRASRINLWYSFGKIVKRAGLDGGRRSKFHQLRRSSATHFAARGGNASELLDHSSPRITKRFYLDPRYLPQGPQPCDVLPSLEEEMPAGGDVTG